MILQSLLHSSLSRRSYWKLVDRPTTAGGNQSLIWLRGLFNGRSECQINSERGLITLATLSKIIRTLYSVLLLTHCKGKKWKCILSFPELEHHSRMLPESQPRPVLPTGQDKCTLQQAAVLLGFAPLVPKAQLSFSWALWYSYLLWKEAKAWRTWHTCNKH